MWSLEAKRKQETLEDAKLNALKNGYLGFS